MQIIVFILSIFQYFTCSADTEEAEFVTRHPGAGEAKALPLLGNMEVGGRWLVEEWRSAALLWSPEGGWMVKGSGNAEVWCGAVPAWSLVSERR